MAKMLQFDDEALRSVLAGVKLLARAVSVTLGPKGRNVVIGKKFGSPLSTKDGVSVAKEINLKNKFENMGAQLVKEVASRTADVAGDGTTTAIVLAHAIFSEGLKNVAAGANPMLVKRGIDKAVTALLGALDRLARPVSTHEEIKQIAAISANNDQSIGAMIAEAMERVGKDGIITADEAKGIETSLDVVEGMRFDKGYLSPYFVNQPEGMVCELANCHILIFDKKISSVKELVPVLERIVKAGATPLLIVAEDIDGEALATLVVNKLKGGLPVCAVKAPGFGDRRKALLQDMAVLTGATLISDEVGMKFEDVSPEVLGSAKRIKITKEDTTIVEGAGSQQAIKVRESEIRAQIEHTNSDYDRQKLEERLASLVGGVAVIHVGAVTESEMKEKKARVEDALHATRAAALGGVVPGGGVALLRAAQALAQLKLEGDEELGKAILFSACFAPATAIGNNCGKAGNLIAEKIYEQSGAFGFNGLTGEFCDLYGAGVIDPLFVTKSALANAASVAGLLLTTAAMVTDKPQPKVAPAAGMDGGMGMGGMGGMGGMPGMM